MMPLWRKHRNMGKTKTRARNEARLAVWYKKCRLRRERCISVIEKAPNAYRASRLSTGADVHKGFD